MKFEIKHSIQMPEGVSAKIGENGKIEIKGNLGTLSRRLFHPKISITVDGGVIIVYSCLPDKDARALAGTFAAHLKNMVTGVSSGFEYRMKMVYAHFPMKLELKGNNLRISNFLGEHEYREARIPEGVQTKIEKDEITLFSIDKELCGQTVTNIERATKVKRKDLRVFQDGVYLKSAVVRSV